MAWIQRQGLPRGGLGRRLHRVAFCFALFGLALGAAAAPPATERFEAALAAAGAGHPALGRFRLEPLLHQPRLPRSQRAFAYYLRGVLFYREGRYVSAGQDYQRALEFDPTLAPARSALAWLHLKGLGVSKAPDRARQLYTLAARQGHQEAQFNAAVLREQGLGGPVDLAGALHYYLAAAERGHEEALLRAGELHAQGQAPAAAQPRIEALLAGAAETGQGDAPYLLATVWLPEDPARALPWLRQAAEAGLAQAQFVLAEQLEQQETAEEALLWLKTAAKQGHRAAQRRLAWSFESGTLAPRDLPEAVRWYTRAAAHRDAYAQTALARLKWTGQGTAKDTPGALALWRDASRQGFEPAQRALAWYLATTPAPKPQDAQEAQRLAEPLASRDPSAENLALLAAAYAAAGDFEAAMRWQRAALAAAPANLPSTTADPAALRRALASYENKERYLEPGILTP